MLCSGTTVFVGMSGCLDRSDDPQSNGNGDRSDENGNGNSGGNGNGVGHPAPPDPKAHPDFDGVTERGFLGTDPAVAWLQSSDGADAALAGFNSDQADEYVADTDFDENGMLVYYQRLDNTCDAIDIPDVTVEDDRVVAKSIVERIEDDGEDCSTRTNLFAALALRVPIDEDRPLAVVNRGEKTISNRYRVELERISDDIIIQEADVTSIDDFEEETRQAIQTAIDEERYETEDVPDSLESVVAKHDYVRDGAAHYELNATFREYVITGEVHENVDNDADVFEVVEFESDSATETARAAVAHANRAEEYRTTSITSEFKEAAENHDYLHWRSMYIEPNIEAVDSDSTYVLEVEPITPHEIVYRVNVGIDWIQVADVTELDDAVQSEIESALKNPYETYNPPALLAAGGRNLYLGVDGETYRPRIRDIVGSAESTFEPPKPD